MDFYRYDLRGKPLCECVPLLKQMERETGRQTERQIDGYGILPVFSFKQVPA